MAEKRFGLVDKNLNIVNVIIWDGVTLWTPPDAVTVLENPDIGRDEKCVLVNNAVAFIKPIEKPVDLGKPIKGGQTDAEVVL